MGTYFTRPKKDRDFTVVDNHYLRNDKLSWKAKGLFTYILSLPEDWKIYLSELETHATDGRDSCATAIRELEANGYITKTQLKDKRGKFMGYRYDVVERPGEQPEPEKPYTENPFTEKPYTENPQLLNTNKPSTKELNTEDTQLSQAKLDDEAVRLGRLLQDLNRQNFPYNRHDPDAPLKWSVDIERLHRLDKRPWELIEAVIIWCQADDFWKGNIESGRTLRKQFDTLLKRIDRERQRKTAKVTVI